MEEAGPSQQQDEPYKWTEEDTGNLIKWRPENEALFTGRRNAAVKAYETFIKDHNLGGKVEAGWVKKKWQNLQQKYKDLKTPRTGVSTEGGETTAATWKWFDAMDEVMGQRPSIAVPHLITSAVVQTVAAVASPPEQNRGQRHTESQLLGYLRDMERREDEREQRAEEREERRHQEERRDMERREREWREWMESRAREERAEREADSRAREERLMAILEHMSRK